MIPQIKNKDMRNSIGIAVTFIFLFISMAFAEISIKAEVGKTSITTDETLTYKLIITSTEKQVPQPEVPKFEGFNVVSQAQSSTFSYLKTGPKTILVFAFILTPTDIGKFKIEPSSIALEGKTYATDTFEIEVTPDKARPKTPLEQRPSQPEKIQPESEEPQITL